MQENIKQHALIGISNNNSYYSIKNMEKIFSYARKNFQNFNIIVMDDVSIFNLMALGYNENKALKKTKRNDKCLQNNILKTLEIIGYDIDESKNKILRYSEISKNTKYMEIYEKILTLYKNNEKFCNDCRTLTKNMLSSKLNNINVDNTNLAIKYLLAELPLCLNSSYILDLDNVIMINKELSDNWKKIYYEYGLLSNKQKILVKSFED
ncbi:tRNA-dependent cyclodipeptide synthase [Powai lake megavirus]|uniref:tRNA-dependent cyclodipeptide synthase n=1 Tax=Powai lake megavirus TaxID=1842663 RepID=A0A167R1P4_9VIRU|nr:tRNA-dependent cyclodipeptide synthase [Powai lake megavirus]ANB50207.1 tRNA-dependent cyclodipeptide synthase [Powai lake megavirus]